MRNIALLIEYDGTAYSGWQVQKNGKSIQAVVEKILTRLLQEDIKVVGAGRTDAGVHACGQVANFRTRSEWEIEKIVYALQSTLPRDIAVHKGVVVPSDFHSRFDAIGRKYSYRIVTRKSPLSGHFAAYFHYDFSIDVMNEAAAFLIGVRSFKSFTKCADQQRYFMCEVTKAEWLTKARERFSSFDLCFEIEANRFLHGMVRAIVGTLVDVGRGKISIEDFKRIIEVESRSYASVSVPACGLFLAEVTYPFDIWGQV
jgi:tRNA pseudouridine38-40 synthase